MKFEEISMISLVYLIKVALNGINEVSDDKFDTELFEAINRKKVDKLLEVSLPLLEFSEKLGKSLISEVTT